MRIAIVSSLFEPFGVGGAEQVAADLAENMHQLGHQVDVISTCRADDLAGAPYRIDSWKDMRVWRIAPWNVYWSYDKHKHNISPSRLARAAWHTIDLWNPSVFRPLSLVLDQIKPDVVNTHNIDGFSPVVWVISRRYAPKVVHTLHDYHLICPKAIMRRGEESCERLCNGCKVYAGYFQQFQKYVDVLIAPANAISELHRASGWIRPQTTVVRNAVPITTTVVGARSSPEALQVTFMGRLEPEKGCRTMLETIDAFRESQDIHFHIAGRGRFENDFARLGNTLPNCTWHGYVEGADKAKLLQTSDIFLQLSECRENAPLGLLEARQKGLYLIGADIGGIPEIIDGPSVGELISPGNANGLRDVLNRCIGRRAQLREQRQYRAALHSPYSMPDMAAAYLDAFSMSASTESAAQFEAIFTE